MVAQQSELVNIPTDRDAYRAFVASLDATGRLLLFGVAPNARRFRCPTNGRHYTAKAVRRDEGGISYLETSCGLCDVFGRSRGEALYDERRPQPHIYPIEEVS